LERPSAARPVTPWARPWRRKVREQEKRNSGTRRSGPRVEPSVLGNARESMMALAMVGLRVTGFSGKRAQVSLAQAGAGAS
jgi:hypothetical protein